MTDTSTLAEASRLVEPPDGSVATVGITVIGYLDPEGDHAWGLRTHGDGSMSEIIGLMETAKHFLLGDNDEEDD